MSKTIVQKIVFKNASAKDLYGLYMDSKKHSKATGANAMISAKEGSKFSAYGDFITGKNLQLVKDRLIVQSWRAKDWKKKESNSTFVITLEQKGKDAVLNAVHANVPDKKAKGIDKGWHEFYWRPWKKYLAGESLKKTSGM